MSSRPCAVFDAKFMTAVCGYQDATNMRRVLNALFGHDPTSLLH
jgi:hypothetical protein